MRKRFLAFLLALICALSLSACGDWDDQATIAVLPVADAQTQTQPPSEAPDEVDSTETEVPTLGLDTQETDTPAPEPDVPETEPPTLAPAVSEDGWYNSKEDVALYIHLYGHLPDNYVTKKEAQDLGWSGGSVERYAGEGTAIGGSYFGNYEGLLPEEAGRSYTECDIDTVGNSSRGAKRIIFSNDGLVYYTEDHYESFVLLYGEP